MLFHLSITFYFLLPPFNSEVSFNRVSKRPMQQQSLPTQYPPPPPPPPPQYPMYPPSPYVYPYPNPSAQPHSKIRDYLPWSIVNVFLGGIILGLIAIFLSFNVKKRSRRGDYMGAEKLSVITLLWNIFASIAGVVIWALIIYAIVIKILSATRNNNNSG